MEWRTAEVRWFYPGHCPDPIADWFHRAADPGEPERRTDEYARLDRDDLGIKLRGGAALDVKVRTGLLAEGDLPPGLAGHAEAWTKWSFPLDPHRPLGLAWLAVEKVRWTQRYEVVGATARPIPPDRIEPAGCVVELASIRIGSTRAWSFGFEAFDTSGDVLGSLRAGARRFMTDASSGSVVFEAGNSCGYPGWLRRIGERGEASQPPAASGE